MATRKQQEQQQASPSLSDFDLATFRQQKEAITKAATAEIAHRIDQIENLLQEIKSISDATGVEFSLYAVNDKIQDITTNWNSSSAYC